MLRLLLATALVASLALLASAGVNKTLVTLNVHLTHAPAYDTRKATLYDQFAEATDDVVCIQGLTIENDIRMFMGVASETLPHSWSFVHTADGVMAQDVDDIYNPCSADDVIDFKDCVNKNCRYALGASDRSIFYDCVMDICQPLEKFSTRCLECVVQPCFKPTDIDASMQCMLVNTDPDTDLCKTIQTDPVATRGMLMMSKTPLTDLKRGTLQDYTSITPVGYLSATVEGVGKVTCTHLTGNLADPFLDVLSPFDSYAAENLNEINELLEMAEAESHDIVLGDFNFGLSDPEMNVTGQFEASFEQAKVYGYKSQNQLLGRCTLCADNFLQSVRTDHTGQNFILDHVFTLESSSVKPGYTQVLLYGLEAMTPCTAGGTLSNHYGVRLTVEV